jgi:hypothetical protein
MAWTCVLDRLPDDDRTVLIYMPQASEPVWLGYLSCESGEWCLVEGFEPDHSVTHWMWLPEGPR